jgi:hypothetical protein
MLLSNQNGFLDFLSRYLNYLKLLWFLRLLLRVGNWMSIEARHFLRRRFLDKKLCEFLDLNANMNNTKKLLHVYLEKKRKLCHIG